MEIQHRIQLVDLLRHFNLPLTACECGCAEGRLSRELLLNGIEKLYLVDCWSYLPTASGDGRSDQSWHDKNYYEAIERVKEFGGKAVMLKGLSVDMAAYVPDYSLGLLYIDADHSYENVLQDLYAYYNKVIDGGVIGLHDVENNAYGVKKAVEEFCSKFDHILHRIPEDEPLNASCWFRKE